MRYELRDYEWGVIKPMLPNKSGGIPRVDGRRILNGFLRRCDQVRRGAIFRRATVPVRFATIASFAGAKRVFGIG
jgi:transposase